MGHFLGIPYASIGGIHAKSLLGATNPNAEEPDTTGNMDGSGSNYEHELNGQSQMLGAAHYTDAANNEPMPGPMGGASWMTYRNDDHMANDKPNRMPVPTPMMMNKMDTQNTLGMMPMNPYHGYESQMVGVGRMMPMSMPMAAPQQMRAADFDAQPQPYGYMNAYY